MKTTIEKIAKATAWMLEALTMCIAILGTVTGVTLIMMCVFNKDMLDLLWKCVILAGIICICIFLTYLISTIIIGFIKWRNKHATPKS